MSAPRYHVRNLRIGRHSQAHRAYLVTTSTWRRRPLFTDIIVARRLVNCLRTEHEAGRAATLAYVLMPDHLHWLFQLGEESTLSQVVGRAKSAFAHRLVGKTWQRGFHDHAVRDDQDLRALARYIVANPVRAGLVDRVGDYPHWDVVWL